MVSDLRMSRREMGISGRLTDFLSSPDPAGNRKRPQDPQLLASIFRTIHTIKGTCGFLGFATLEGVTHLAENILSQLRDGKRQLTPELVTLILETVDVVKT